MRCSHTTGIDVIKFQTITDIATAKTVYIIPCGPFNGNGEWNKVARSVSDCQSFQLRTSERATDRISVIITLKTTALPLHLACPSMTFTTSNEECRKIVSL